VLRSGDCACLRDGGWTDGDRSVIVVERVGRTFNRASRTIRVMPGDWRPGAFVTRRFRVTWSDAATLVAGLSS
jgi:hypothetical protein